MEAIVKAGYKPGEEVFLAMDVAATEFYDEESERYIFEGKKLTSKEMGDVYQEMVEKYPIISIERTAFRRKTGRAGRNPKLGLEIKSNLLGMISL